MLTHLQEAPWGSAYFGLMTLVSYSLCQSAKLCVVSASGKRQQTIHNRHTFITPFKMEYACLVSLILSFISTPPALVILYMASSTQQPDPPTFLYSPNPTQPATLSSHSLSIHSPAVGRSMGHGSSTTGSMAAAWGRLERRRPLLLLSNLDATLTEATRWRAEHVGEEQGGRGASASMGLHHRIHGRHVGRLEHRQPSRRAPHGEGGRAPHDKASRSSSRRIHGRRVGTARATAAK
jgi:hypothetical protein